MSEEKSQPGYIHVYTGNGKGKTTAALGLALRMLGAGKRVFFGQFVKGMHYSELDVLDRLPGIVVKQFGRGCFIEKNPDQKDIDAARAGLKEMAQVLKAGKFQLVVMDEVCIALLFRLFSFAELKSGLDARAPGVEVVLTGRSAPAELIELADLVSEMKEIKHYYSLGVPARRGIEK